MYKHTSILALILAVGLLAGASPAQALYIETPLNIHSPTDHADVGDDLDLTIGPNPNNASAEDQWADKQVKVRYSYDKNEGSDGPDAPTSDAGYTEGDITTVTLDGEANGIFTWTIPSTVDDRNIHLFLEDAAGERLAFTNIAIGNATPMMYIMNGPADGDLESAPETEDATSEEAAGLGLLGLIGAVGVAALGFAMLRRRQ